MDTLRFILLVAFGLVSLMIWQTWQQDYAPPPSRTAQEPETGAPSEPEDATGVPDLPEATDTAPAIADTEPSGGKTITVSTDVFEIHIDTQGGTLREVRLPQYPVSVRLPDQPYVMMTDDRAQFYVAQGGLLSEQSAPSHKDLLQAEQDSYVLAPGQDQLEVRLSWRDDTGVVVDKIYVFHRGSYAIDVGYAVRNNSNTAWKGWAYGQLQRSDPDGGGMRLIYTYTGAALSSPDNRYNKISFDDMRDKAIDRRITNGWAAMLQHYFVSALLPASRDEPYRYYSLVLDRDTGNARNTRYVIGATTPPLNLEPGAEGELKHRLYIGPKRQDRLKALAPGLDLTVDYGILWFIAKPLFWALDKLHTLVGNWGVAIILLTLFIKIAFYHLSAAGYRSMAKMRRVQPRLLALRERYANDKQRLNQAMMDLYKQEKINPLGGCLPIVVQIPVFIALYWVLLESVELRQAPLFLWIQDLSIPDPYFVLPLIMGVTMFIQQKLNPTPVDPVQEKIMMSLPVVFTVFFAFFPAGLVLYWVVNNVLSIAQQWLITRNLEQGSQKA